MEGKKTVSDHSPFSILHSSLFILLAIYLVWFFATPFEPYRGLFEGGTPMRFSFFSYILLPDEYFGSWLGPDGVVSLRDRLPILLTAVFCIASATGIGLFFLTVTRIAKRISVLETWLFSSVLGGELFSLLMLWFGIRGQANDVPGIRSLTGFGVLVLGILCSLRQYWDAYDSQGPYPPPENVEWKFWRWTPLKLSTLFVVLPIFTLLLLLAGMVPSTDYDVVSYHLAGTRECYEAGRIDFLPHNVYANMPFGAEMFALWGMNLTGDAFTGALVGKTLIALTTPLTALGIYAFGRRFFTENAGLLGMLLYLTTPWILYVSSVGLIDTVVGMYAFYSLYAAILAGTFFRGKLARNLGEPHSTEEVASPVARRHLDRAECWMVVLSGCFAGGAAACKYPAALFVVFPLGLYLLADRFLKRKYRAAILTGILFLSAVFIFCGGWYVKNALETGNPVYPLFFSIFGDSTESWNATVDARWREAHSPHGFGPTMFLHDFLRVGLTSPWNAPLVVPFFLLSLFFARRAPSQVKTTIRPLLAWLVFFFACWWFLTHRIDRFWLPTLPALCMLAGFGMSSFQGRFWKYTLTGLLAISAVYGFLLGGAPAPGKANRFLASLESLRKDPALVTPWAAWFNTHPPEGKILLVGDAKSFLYEAPVLYSTCWNETPLRKIALSEDPGGEFRRRDIEWVLVDVSEIARFRSPGNYGFTDFVQPELFDRLVAEGVLMPFPAPEEIGPTPVAVYRIRPVSAPQGG